MRWSFRTNGDYIDFVHTDETSLAIESVIFHLHNTSRCIEWTLPSDTTRITFIIDGRKYENILITDVDFDGTAMNSQDDFETGITAMFEGLAGGEAEPVAVYQQKVILTDAEIKALPTSYINAIDAPGAGKMLMFISATFRHFFAGGAYTNISANGVVGVCYGDWDENASIHIVMPTSAVDLASLVGIWSQIVDVGGGSYVLKNPSSGVENYENKPLKIFAENTAGDFTGGNASNALEVTICYAIVDL